MTNFKNGTEVIDCRDRTVKAHLWKVRRELSIDTQGLVLRCQNVVLQRQLWARAIDLAHHSHQGMDGTKKKLRAITFVPPNMDAGVEARVIQCQACGAQE